MYSWFLHNFIIVINSVDRCAFKNPCHVQRNISLCIGKSRRAFRAVFRVLASLRGYLPRRSIARGKDFRGFRFGCCIAGKVFLCQMVHAADPVSTAWMSHIRFMPFRTWREFRRISADRDFLMAAHSQRYFSQRYRPVLSPPFWAQPLLWFLC